MSFGILDVWAEEIAARGERLAAELRDAAQTAEALRHSQIASLRCDRIRKLRVAARRLRAAGYADCAAYLDGAADMAAALAHATGKEAKS